MVGGCHGPVPVRLTSAEYAAQAPSQDTVRTALTRFHQDGIVIIENAVDHSMLDHIRKRMLQDLPRNLASPNVHYNHGTRHGNVSQSPPLLARYVHEAVWVNRIAVKLMEQIIGPKPQFSFITSNIALPGGQGRQAVHSDYYCEHYTFPVFLEVCIFLEDVDSSNGSTELWLGTHHGYTKSDHTFADMGWIKNAVFSRRANIRPPVQPAIPKGSLCIRDIRMWHAGMPNRTAIPRIMLGFMFSPAWFGSRMRLKLPKETKAIVETWNHVESLTELVQEDVDYLRLGQELILSERHDMNDRYIRKHGTVAAGENDYWESDPCVREYT